MRLSEKFEYGLVGFVAGSAWMYLLDSRNGRRRRAHIRDKTVHATHRTELAVEAGARDLAHRTRGLWMETLGRLERHPINDAVLEERVRAELGRVCSHPRAIEVACHDGAVILRGPILSKEAKHVLHRIMRVRGVRDVDPRWELHEEPDIPALQGGIIRNGSRFELLQDHWAPGPRFIAGALGAALSIRAINTRTPLAIGSAVAGGLLLLRSLTNMPLKTTLGVGDVPPVIDVVKEIHVRAPIEEVFAYWSAMENFPRFMTHVKQVRRLSDTLYHWKVQGLAGIPVEWEAEVTAFIPNQLLAWRSINHARVRHTGTVRFDPHEHGGTRLNIRMRYTPPAGALGHAIAKLMGAEPKKQIDDDMVRFKSLIEHGKATGRETVRKEEIPVVQS